MAEVTLTWKEQHMNLCGTFQKLLEESVLVDCTLAAEGKYVKAHKTILSAFSPFLQLLFTQESEKNPIVILTHIKFQELKALIDFIYRGKVKVSEEYLEDFLHAAESLQIKGLGRDHIKDQMRNGTTMTFAQELPNDVSHIPLDQHQVNEDSGNETCGTAPLSYLEANMDFEGLSTDSPQMEHLNSCQINQSSTSVNVVDDSIPSRLSNGECELKSIPSTNSLILETDTKCKPTSEEEIQTMEDDAPYCYLPTETSTSPSRLVTARGLQTDSLASCEPNQCTSSAGDLDNSDQNLLGPVSCQQRQGDGEHFNSESTFPCASFTDERLEKNTVDLMPRIEFTETCKEFVTEGSVSEMENSTSEIVGAAAEYVEVKIEEAEAEGAPSLACVECGEVFGDASQLSEHVRTHSPERTFACPVCGKDFKYLSLLTQHMRAHTGERPYACEYCDKAYASAKTLKEHMPLHTGELPYDCDQCGNAFSSSYRLKHHVCTHNVKRPYGCHVCGKAFSKKKYLKGHLVTHPGGRRYNCKYCDKVCASVKQLKRHMLSAHPGGRRFDCKYCDKVCASAQSLIQHTRTHTGECPYPCLMCKKAFKTSSALKHHQRIRHSGERPGPAARVS